MKNNTNAIGKIIAGTQKNPAQVELNVIKMILQSAGISIEILQLQDNDVQIQSSWPTVEQYATFLTTIQKKTH